MSYLLGMGYFQIVMGFSAVRFFTEHFQLYLQESTKFKLGLQAHIQQKQSKICPLNSRWQEYCEGLLISIQMSIPNETGKSHIRAHISKLEFGKPIPWNTFMASNYRQQQENTVSLGL